MEKRELAEIKAEYERLLRLYCYTGEGWVAEKLKRLSKELCEVQDEAQEEAA